jgi:hypothetical protein
MLSAIPLPGCSKTAVSAKAISSALISRVSTALST